MADNEQELLGDEIISIMSLITHIGTSEASKQYVAGQILAKFKAMGYVKWDSEEVAAFLRKMPFGREPTRSWCKFTADQLKEILVGGI